VVNAILRNQKIAFVTYAEKRLIHHYRLIFVSNRY
jgi:hypothetical protein